MRTPEILHFQATERCNLACPGCYLPERTGPGEPAQLVAARVFRPLAEAGVRLATLTGGEPLMHPQFVALCAEACRVFDSVQVVSNGLMLDTAMFSRLREAGVASIKVSLDGASPAAHDALRGKAGAFARTVGNLRAIMALAEHERSGVELGVITTVHPENVGELADIAALAREIGLHHALVQPFHPFCMVYPPSAETVQAPGATPQFLDVLAGQIGRLKADKATAPDFVDNSLEMLDKFEEFYVRPGGPSQLCGADRFVFVNSLLEVRGCLFCRPLASLRVSSPAEVFGSQGWKGFQAFRRGCSLCLMGCQFQGKAQRLSQRGFALWNEGHRDVAKRLFEASLAREYSVEAEQGLGMSLKELGRTADAELHFRNVLEARPDHPYARIDLCECLRRQGRHAEAAQMLERLVNGGYVSPLVRHQYGVSLIALGRHAEALDQILHALREKPNHAWMRFDLGMVLNALGRPQESLEHFLEAARLDPEVPWFHFRLGLTLAGLGQMAEALAEMRRAVELAPDAARTNLEMARLLLRDGNAQDAAWFLARAREIDPAFVAKEYPEGSSDAN